MPRWLPMRGASRPTNILCRFTRSMFVRVQLSPPPRVWCGHPRERMAVARGDRVLEVPPRERLREVRGLAEDRGAGRTTCQRARARDADGAIGFPCIEFFLLRPTSTGPRYLCTQNAHFFGSRARKLVSVRH